MCLYVILIFGLYVYIHNVYTNQHTYIHACMHTYTQIHTPGSTNSLLGYFVSTCWKGCAGVSEGIMGGFRKASRVVFVAEGKVFGMLLKVKSTIKSELMHV